MQQSIPRRVVRRLGGRPVRPGCDFTALAAVILEYPSSRSLVLLLAFLEALATPAVLAGQTIRRPDVEAILERVRVTLQYTSTRLFRQYKIVAYVFLEARVRYSHVLRSRDDDTLTRLIDVVLHAEVSRHPVDEHTIVRRHVRKLVAYLLTILSEFYEILFNSEQNGTILLIAVYRHRNKLLEICTRAVRVDLRAAI